MNSIDPRLTSTKYCTKQISVKFSERQYDFSQTHFIIDENYVGIPPKLQVSIENLNDNIDEKFLAKDLLKLGKIRTIEIVRHPETRQHLGLAKIQFEDPKVAQTCAEAYNGKQLMGKQLSVYTDIKFAIIERKIEEKLRPQPVVVPDTPKPQPPLPSLPVLTPLPFPPIQLPQPLIDLPRSLNRQHTSLDDRLAKLGLKPSNAIPSTPPQKFSVPDKRSTFQPFHHQNHITNKFERKDERDATNTVKSHQKPKVVEESEKDWNPEPSPAKVNIALTDEQIWKEVLPHCFKRLFEELQRNLITTLRRRLVQTVGYPYIEKAQNEHKSAQNKLELERQKKALEAKYMNRLKDFETDRNTHQSLQRKPTAIRRTVIDRWATSVNLKRTHRSATQIGASIDSHSDDSSDIRSRSPSRFRSISRSSSSISVSSDSSEEDSQSQSSYSESSSSSAHISPSPRPTAKFKIESDVGSTSQLSTYHRGEHEIEAAESLVSLRIQSNSANENREPIGSKTEIKKRKNKELEQENRAIKRQKKVKIIEKPVAQERKPKQTEIEGDDEFKDLGPYKFEPRSDEEKNRLNNDLTTISDEDIVFLRRIHEQWQMQDLSADAIRVPFGSDQANSAHLNSTVKNIETEKDKHPKWWRGCSRCSPIEISDKGRIEEEETKYEDLTKAPIKSHVIQAANSTRRDQRSDQRRIAALNPEIDPSFLKQFTSNTLQMRAKNLRFSRSKIHKWGLFACEKIANGDAVIEYVGEKIRPSVADHRELVVYPNDPNHDGSSYFFRVDTDVIDATLKGNKARFINHSCNPNCIAKVIKHENGTNSIVIYAKQTINEDEEITYDYKFPREEGDNKIQCNCRAPNCQKFLN